MIAEDLNANTSLKLGKRQDLIARYGEACREGKKMRYKVNYKGFYIVEADSAKEAIETDREVDSLEYEEWENVGVELIEEEA